MIPLLILTPAILLAAIGAAWKARPVHAALLLALCLSLVGCLYVAMGAHFIGLVQFSVYVGAVAILIVFSLLITRPSDDDEEKVRRMKTGMPALACSLPLLVMLGFTMFKQSALLEAPADEPAMSLKVLGEILFTDYAPAVLAMAVLLTAVMIGAALFAREPSKKPEPPSDS
ncbi:MAG: NADH-quinone oxidoreductase subunit J family protein [Verrucomicrobiales bacterium]|nr:NADH-quinone oxidoreductase subunit J [Verrucomicrobiota bacterium JB025]